MSSRKDEASGSNDFVKKLFQMLLQEKYTSIVRWTALGNLFVVLDTNEFTKDVLPRHFKHSNFASFVRQLNKYDFHKVKISNEEKQHYEYGDDAWEFQHPEFRKDDKDALENIRRKAPTKKEPAYEANPHYDSQIAMIRLELQSLRDDHRALAQKYRAVLESMVALRSFNERQARCFHILSSVIADAGIKVPPMDIPSPTYYTHDPPQIKPESGNHLPADPAGNASGPSGPTGPTGPTGPSATTSAAGPAAGLSAGQPPSAAPASTAQTSAASAPAPAHGHASHGSHGSIGSAGLPVAEGLVPPGVHTTTIPNPKFHVLLVEDDNVCITLSRKFLVKYGCQVTVVTDGLNAIDTVRNQKFDLVLMDIVMPNLDGATATHFIRSFDTSTPIIAMTANIQEHDLVTYLQNGMSDILAKPFSKDDLYAILTKHLLNPAKQAEYDSPSDIRNLLVDSNGHSDSVHIQPMSQPMGQQLPDHMGLSMMEMDPDHPTKKQRMR